MEEGHHSPHGTLPALPLSPQIVLDTKYWTVLSFLMVTASLLLFCLFSFLTQSVDAFRIAPAIFHFPGEVPQGSFPSLAVVLAAVSHPVEHLLVATSRSAVLTFNSNSGAISSLEPPAPSQVGACPPALVPSAPSPFPTQTSPSAPCVDRCQLECPD